MVGSGVLKEKIMKAVFFTTACISILAVGLICFFLFVNGTPAIKEIGVIQFLFGKTWRPGNGDYGILPMIVGSLYVTAGAIIIGVPIGILTAVFLARFCPEKIYPVVKAGVELMAGIPSVVYGFFAFWKCDLFDPDAQNLLDQVFADPLVLHDFLEKKIILDGQLFPLFESSHGITAFLPVL